MPSVLDAFATLPWCFDDEATPATEHLLMRASRGEEFLVPAHWATEVLNSLLRGRRRGRVTAEHLREFLRDLSNFRIVIAQPLQITDLRRIQHLAERLSISAYDAAYLDLAQHRGVALATLDEALARACRSEGVPLLLQIRPETT